MKFLIYMFTLSRILTCIHVFYDCRSGIFNLNLKKKKEKKLGVKVIK